MNRWIPIAFIFAITAVEVLAQAPVRWIEIEPGLATAEYELEVESSFLRSPVLLAKFSPQVFKLVVADARDIGSATSDIKTLTQTSRGIAGINASFFDPENRPLGLVVSNSVEKQKVHKGGSLLNGILAVESGLPKIIERSTLKGQTFSEAVQAGPILIKHGLATTLNTAKSSSRRSGIALTKSGELILFCTLLRFPGATLSDLQRMLLKLEVTDALNFDGGGSSQMFLERQRTDSSEVRELLIGGGDAIPVGVVLKRKPVPIRGTSGR